METIIQPLNFDTLIKEYIDDLKLRNYEKSTRDGYKTRITSFTNFLTQKNTNLSQVSKKELKQYLVENQHLSFRTLIHAFSALNSFMNYLIYEELILNNPIPIFRERYLRTYKKQGRKQIRQIISVQQMSQYLNSIIDPRDKAVTTLFAKTGIRRTELIDIDLDDIDWERNQITLKPKGKRSNLIIYFDNETRTILERWIRIRNEIVDESETALFTNIRGNRLKRRGIQDLVTKYATRQGLHDQKSKDLSKHFTAHCFRHWFTTHLRRNEMPRDMIKELRGDARRDAMDIYYHIDQEDLRTEYLRAIPRLGLI